MPPPADSSRPAGTSPPAGGGPTGERDERITPRTLAGFRDLLPEAMIPREELLSTVRRVYRSYGFSPIDTPTLEYLDILLGKGGAETDKQLYRFRDHGNRDVGLRFDLTVPLARFVAQHMQELGSPFKRYHIGNVFRGERQQRGRYREFMQCDFDTIGSTSIVVDIEAVLVVHDLLHALGIERFTIRVNNRRILNGLLEKCGLADQSVQVLRAIDKLDKIGPAKVLAEIEGTASATSEQAGQVLSFATLSGEPDAVLAELASLIGGNEQGEAGVAELVEVLRGVEAAGIRSDAVRPDVAIARGLDYYTGTVLETSLDDLTDIGSVASGGRYDDLTGVYTKEPLPGMGASLGLDRLLAAMEELGQIEAVRTPAVAFVPFFAAERQNDYVRLAHQIRTAGISTEMYPDCKRLAKQLKHASRCGHRVALIIGSDEFEQGTCQVKDLADGTNREVPLDEGAAAIIESIRSLLG